MLFQVTIQANEVSSEVMFAHERLDMLYWEVHAVVYIETLSVPQDVTEHHYKHVLHEVHLTPKQIPQTCKVNVLLKSTN